uniref:Papilin n=1 Tax=Parascaris univalens TaxID=6257 RepID=A0A915C9J3_PARUN
MQVHVLVKSFVGGMIRISWHVSLSCILVVGIMRITSLPRRHVNVPVVHLGIKRYVQWVWREARVSCILRNGILTKVQENVTSLCILGAVATEIAFPARPNASICAPQRLGSAAMVGEDDVCMMERDSGPCTDSVTQWYFDASEYVCKQFTYGGCRGNGNRFDTRKQCEKRCSPRSQELVAINSERVCTLSFEAGRCRESQQKWYFDNTVGYCRMFVYSGCSGNDNRFDSENECMRACSSLASKHAMDNRASLSLVGQVPRAAGSVVELNCATHGLQPVRWFKDGRALDYEVENDPRIQISDFGSLLLILDARESDSGDYSCAAGHAAILSDPVRVIIKAIEVSDGCVDQGNQMTCRLIIKAGLCANARYGNFCCRTCTESGYKL